MLNYAKSSRGSKYHILGSSGKALCKYTGYNTKTPVNILPEGAVVCKSCLMIKEEKKEVKSMPTLLNYNDRTIFEVNVEFCEKIVAKDEGEAEQFMLKMIREGKVTPSDTYINEV